MTSQCDRNNLFIPHNKSEIKNPQSEIKKVLLVDDSQMALAILKRMLSLSPDIEVVATAKDGKEALELIPKLQPDVICTDLHMPVMNGLDLCREVMARFPRPILVVSVSVQEGSLNVFKLLEAGALDVFVKPSGILDSDIKKIAPELIRKIRILSGVHVFRKIQKEKPAEVVIPKLRPVIEIPRPLRMVVIGASTGGPQALQHILSQLASDYDLPIICVQHIGEGFLQGFLGWLADKCRLTVKIARPGEVPWPGTIYFPEERSHLKIDSSGRFCFSKELTTEGFCPSITVAMRSAVEYYGSEVAGVLLTGMGRDGAEGLLSVSRAGGLTIAQDEESSIIFGMPKQAIALGAAKYILSLDEIALSLIQLRQGKTID